MPLSLRDYERRNAGNEQSERALKGAFTFRLRERYLLTWREAHDLQSLTWAQQAVLLVNAGLLEYGQKWRERYVSMDRLAGVQLPGIDQEPPALNPLALTGAQRFELWNALQLARFHAPDPKAREQYEAALEVLK